MSSSPYMFYIPIHLYPTPSASGKRLVILFVPRRITDGNHLFLYIVSQKIKKVNPIFCISIAILCTCIILRNHPFYATGISLRILPAKSHKIIFSTWYHPIYFVLFPPQDMDKSEPNNTRYPPFSSSGTLGDKVLHSIVREKLLELAVELCRQGLIMGDDQRRFIQLCDDIRHRKRLARSGDATS